MSGDDAQVSVDTLREDVSGDADLVTVAAADVRAVLDRLAELAAMELRARAVEDWDPAELHDAARYILTGELS